MAAAEYFQIIAIGRINMMGKALQQGCDDRRTGTKERGYKGREKDCSLVCKDLGSQG